MSARQVTLAVVAAFALGLALRWLVQPFMPAAPVSAVTTSVAPTHVETTTASSEAASQPPSVASGDESRPSLQTCQIELAQCRKAGWQLAFDAMALSSNRRDEDHDDDGEDSPVDSSFAAQQRFLCDHAMEKMRGSLRADHENYLKAAPLLHSERIYDAFANQFTKTLDELGLTTPQSSKEVADGFAALYAQYGRRIRQAAADQDVATLFRELTALFHAEDELVKGLLGPEALQWFRGEMLGLRTLMLAHTAAQGDIPWHGSLKW